MSDDDVSIGTGTAFAWKQYSCSARDKEPLLKFIEDALISRGCTVHRAGPAYKAPFHIVVGLPGGERMSVLVYAFLANSKATNKRPDDEHRFQIKYGGDLKGVLEVAVDPLGLTTTIFIGIDPERGIFVAADPIMNNPSPMSRSVEFKTGHVAEMLSRGWFAWDRPRKDAKTTTRRSHELLPDVRTEVLIGGRQERLLDLILFERVAQGLDPGDRHLLADKFRDLRGKEAASKVSHSLLDELSLTPEALLDLISSAARLKMAVRGWVAEAHLETRLRAVRGVSECHRINGERMPDISLRWKESKPILIECKNVLRDRYADGSPKLDFQRTRASTADRCSRYYTPSDFHVVAACLHPVTESWDFQFALTSELPTHNSCAGRIDSNLRVSGDCFSAQVESVLDRAILSL